MFKIFRKNSEFGLYFSLFLLASGLYLPIIFSDKTTLIPSYQDQTQWQIYREFINQSFANGYFPLWCEALFSGLDFAGWGHSSAFYPLAFFFFWFKFTRAATLNQFLHLTITFFGFYFLARKIGLRKIPAFLSTVGYGLVSFLPSMMEDFLPDIFARSLIPWIYGLSLELIQNFRKQTLLILSIIFGIQLLSGHLELIALQDLSLVIFFLIYILFKPGIFKLKFKGLALWFVSLLGGGILGIVSVLPSLGSYSQSFRKLGFSYELFTFFPTHTLYLEVLPLLLISLSLVFIFYLCFSLKSRTPIFWAIIFVLFFNLAQSFNWFNILWIFYHLPFFKGFIPHGRAIPQAMLALFLLLGIGIDNSLSLPDKKLPRIFIVMLLFLEAIYFYLIKYVLSYSIDKFPYEFQEIANHFLLSRHILSGLVILIGIIGIIFYRKTKLKYIKFLEISIALEFIIAGYLLPVRHSSDIMEPPADYLNFLSRIDPFSFRIQSVYSYDQWEKLKIPLQTGVLYHTRAPDAYITFAPLRYTEFLQLLDEKAFSYRDKKVQDVQVPNILKRGDFISIEKLPLINLLNLKYMVGQNKNLKASSDYFIGYEFYRFNPRLNVKQGESFKKLIIKPPSRFGLRLYINKDDQILLRMEKEGKKEEKIIFQLYFISEHFIKKLIYQKLIDGDEEIRISLESLDKQTGDLIFSFLAFSDSNSLTTKKVYAQIYNPNKYFKKLEGETIDIFENPGALPRAFMVHGVKIIADKEKRLKALRAEDFDPSQTAILERELGMRFPEKLAMSRGESIKVIKEESASEFLKILIKNYYPAVLVVSQVYYPGFRAYLNGEEVKIFPVNHSFQGILIPKPGLHKLELRYEPINFRIALWMEICGIIIWIFLMSIRCRSSKYNS